MTTPAEAVVAEAERAVRLARNSTAMAHVVEVQAGMVVGFVVGAVDAMERRGIDTTDLRETLVELFTNTLAAIDPP